ncbi:MAG: hypothetical protein MI739_06260 [Bacteroidales bacterium]|nr:hypothetical protein [Bacteroidales bacterium]
MNKIKKIQNLKEDIQDIYSIVTRFENTNQMHQLDIDLALSKVRNLYDLFLKLNNKETETTEFQEKEISTNHNPIFQEKTLIKGEQIEKDFPDIKSEDIISEKKVQETFEVTKTKTLPKKEKVLSSPKSSSKLTSKTNPKNGTSEIIADKFQSKKFIYDNISKKNNPNDLSSKMQFKPIKDINTAIGLNDKFIFIRELFNGDKESYHETIQVLNNFDTFDNAFNFLTQNFDWNAEDANFVKLTELVRRKYL